MNKNHPAPTAPHADPADLRLPLDLCIKLRNHAHLLPAAIADAWHRTLNAERNAVQEFLRYNKGAKGNPVRRERLENELRYHYGAPSHPLTRYTTADEAQYARRIEAAEQSLEDAKAEVARAEAGESNYGDWWLENARQRVANSEHNLACYRTANEVLPQIEALAERLTPQALELLPEIAKDATLVTPEDYLTLLETVLCLAEDEPLPVAEWAWQNKHDELAGKVEHARGRESGARDNLTRAVDRPKQLVAQEKAYLDQLLGQVARQREQLKLAQEKAAAFRKDPAAHLTHENLRLNAARVARVEAEAALAEHEAARPAA